MLAQPRHDVWVGHASQRKQHLLRDTGANNARLKNKTVDGAFNLTLSGNADQNTLGAGERKAQIIEMYVLLQISAKYPMCVSFRLNNENPMQYTSNVSIYLYVFNETSFQIIEQNSPQWSVMYVSLRETVGFDRRIVDDILSLV